MVDRKIPLQRFRSVRDADGVRHTTRRPAEERSGRCQTPAVGVTRVRADRTLPISITRYAKEA
jgi:hypothetical protein